MKRLELYTGGHPFKIDDLNHLQDGFKEEVISIIQGLGVNLNESIIVCGANLTLNGNTANVTDGVIYLGQKFYIIKQQTYNPVTALNKVKLQVKTSVFSYPGYDPTPGQEVEYENGDKHDVHMFDELILTTSTQGTFAYPTKSLKQALAASTNDWSNTSGKTTILSNNNDLDHKTPNGTYKILDTHNLKTLYPGIVDSTQQNVIPGNTNAYSPILWGVNIPDLTNNITNGIIPLCLHYGYPTPLEPNGWLWHNTNPIANLFGNAKARTKPNTNITLYGYYSLAFFGIISWNYAQYDEGWGSQIIHGKPVLPTDTSYGIEVVNNKVSLPGVNSSIIKQENHGATEGQQYWHFFDENNHDGFVTLKWESSGGLSIISSKFRQFSIVGHLYVSYHIDSF